MKLVVGLGNPRKKYRETRHNVGFEAVAELARRLQADPPRSRFDGEVCEATVDGEKVLLLLPQTYMNLSGRSVRQAADFYKLAPADVLVVCDDFNLPLGELRTRARGSDGGQKGLADICRQLGTQEVARLRIGIGPVPDRWDAADFVLSKFNKRERDEIDLQIRRTVDAVETWIKQGVEATMNQFNGKP